MYSVNDPPAVIDIEASGFGTEAYPIEIGVALSTGETFCSLIQPEPEWEYWDDEAEKVHRVPRDLLELYGRPINDVTDELNQLMVGQTAFSDGWEVDKPWLSQLFWAAKTEMLFGLSALDFILSDTQMQHWHATKDKVIEEMNLKRHRASLDAVVIQTTYMRTRSLTS